MSSPKGTSTADGTSWKTRAWWLLAGLAAIGCGLALRALLDGLIAQRGGEVMYAVMVYAAVCAIKPLPPATAGVAAFSVCFLIEAFQLTGVPADLREQHWWIWLALGSEFTPEDLISYLVGAVLAAVGHHWLARAAAA